jgi:hypothetical protein
MEKNLFVIGFNTHKGMRYVDVENTNWGVSNEYDALIFETKDAAEIFINNDKDTERLCIIECEPLPID